MKNNIFKNILFFGAGICLLAVAFLQLSEPAHAIDNPEECSHSFVLETASSNDVALIQRLFGDQAEVKEGSKYLVVAQDCPGNSGIAFYYWNGEGASSSGTSLPGPFNFVSGADINDKIIVRNLNTYVPNAPDNGAVKDGYNPGRSNEPIKYAEAVYNWRNQIVEDIEVNNAGVAQNYLRSVKSGDEDSVFTNDPASRGGGGSAVADEPVCQSTPGLTWIVCTGINFLSEVITWIQKNIIQPFLTVDPLRTHENGNETSAYSAWKGIRTLANILLVLIFFGIIFGQTFGIDAYTVKKMLPRLVIAVIAIQFSFFIAAIMVDITNVLGAGIRDLLTAPLPAAQLRLSNLSGSLVVGSGLVAGAIAIPAILATVAATSSLFLILIGLAMAMFLVFFTLIFRQILIVALAIFIPVALVAWILPNTEKFFKMWWSLFSRALLMYPLIIVLFAAGDIIVNIALSTTGSGGTNGIEDGSRVVVALAALIVPLALIPATFKVAGAAITAISGMIGNSSKRVLDGRDGKSGIRGRLAENAAHEKTEIAAGMGGSNALGKMFKRSGIVQMGARPGIGYSKKSKAQAATAMNMEIGGAEKDLDAKGFNDRESLGHFAEIGHSRKTFDNRIDALRSSNVQDDHLVADKLEMMRNFVGKQAYQAAALKRSAEYGGAGNNRVGKDADGEGIVVGNAFKGTAQAFSGNTAIASQVVGDAAFATRKSNLAESGWTVNPDGSAYNKDETLQRNIVRSKSSDLMAQPDLSKLDKHIKTVLSKGDESAEQLQKSLSAAMSSPMNDASPHNKAYIQKLINEGHIPKTDIPIQPVRVIHPDTPSPRIVTPDEARRDSGPKPGDPGTRP